MTPPDASGHAAALAPMTDAEWRQRVDLAASYRLVAHFGMDDRIYTHISARVPDTEDQLLLNPFGLWFSEVTASNLVKVDLEGNVVDDPGGYGINKAGFTIHSAVHAVRHDLDCVLHTHTRAGVAVSCLEEGLLPLNQQALQFHGRIAYHDYEGIALDLDERDRLTADLGDKQVMILRNHGLLTGGRSVAEAFKLMYGLNRACETQIDILACGRELVWPTGDVQEKTVGQFDAFYDDRETAKMSGGDDAQDMEWQAYLRLLDRLDPSYKS